MTKESAICTQTNTLHFRDYFIENVNKWPRQKSKESKNKLTERLGGGVKRCSPDWDKPNNGWRQTKQQTDTGEIHFSDVTEYFCGEISKKNCVSIPEQMMNRTLQWLWLGCGQGTAKSSFFFWAWLESNGTAAWQSLTERALKGREGAFFKYWISLIIISFNSIYILINMPK